MARKQAVSAGQTFSINAAGAATVFLAADFTQWQKNALPMKKTKGSTWALTVPLAPGTYHYRFIVDGEWRDDPDCTLRIPNTFGSQDNVRVVS